MQPIQLNQHQLPQGMPLIQIPPDYYHQHHSFVPGGVPLPPPNAYMPAGQFPYPYMPPPPPQIEYMNGLIQNDGLIPVAFNNMPVHVMKPLNSPAVNPGHMSPSANNMNHEFGMLALFF